MGRAGALAAPQESLRAHYAEGLAAYRACRFDDARMAFNAALESAPGEGPSRAMLARIAQFEASPPAADWDGAWRMDSK
jgi:adenylate cyclase